jgi:flagellar motor switch protein FliN/FliY
MKPNGSAMHASHPGNAADSAVASDQSRTEVSLIELGELPELQVHGPALLDGRLDLIGDVKVRLRAMLGQGEISVAELFAIRDGSVLPLQCGVHPLVDIELDQKTIARGELVVVGDTLGVRVTEVSRGLA